MCKYFQDANEDDIKVFVCVFMFDLLYLNGRSLVQEPFIERRRLLREHFKQVDSHFHFATSIDVSKLEEVEEFLEESVKGEPLLPRERVALSTSVFVFYSSSLVKDDERHSKILSR